MSYYNFYMGLNWRVGIHFGQNVAKNIDIKNSSYKSCLELNFLQKTQWTYTFISPRSEARRLQRLPFLKNYNVLEWEKRFTLGPNSAKNTYNIKKCLQQKLFRIKFSTNNSTDAYLYLPKEWSKGRGTFAIFKINYNVLVWESRFTLGLNASKSTDCIEKCFKQKLYKIKFPLKNSVGAYVYFPQY